MNETFNSDIEERKSKNVKSEVTFVGVKSSAIEKFEKSAGALFLL